MAEEDQAVLDARRQLDKLALEYRELLDEINENSRVEKGLKEDKAGLHEQMKSLLLLTGGKHTVDGVITLSIRKKQWWKVVKEKAAEAKRWMWENEPALLAVGHMKLRSWCKEREEQGEELPDWINVGEDVTVRHRSH